MHTLLKILTRDLKYTSRENLVAIIDIPAGLLFKKKKAKEKQVVQFWLLPSYGISIKEGGAL
jgi:hypothetical protein